LRIRDTSDRIQSRFADHSIGTANKKEKEGKFEKREKHLSHGKKCEGETPPPPPPKKGGGGVGDQGLRRKRAVRRWEKGATMDLRAKGRKKQKKRRYESPKKKGGGLGREALRPPRDQEKGKEIRQKIRGAPMGGKKEVNGNPRGETKEKGTSQRGRGQTSKKRCVKKTPKRDKLSKIID